MAFEETEKLEGYAVFENIFPLIYKQSKPLLTERCPVVGGRNVHNTQVCKANSIVWWTILRLRPVCKCFPLPVFVLSPLV